MRFELKHIIEGLEIHIDTLWRFILLLVDGLGHFRPSQQLMNILIYENHSFRILTILLFNFFHELVDLLPIVIIHVLWSDLNPWIFPIGKLQVFIRFFLTGKPVLFV